MPLATTSEAISTFLKETATESRVGITANKASDEIIFYYDFNFVSRSSFLEAITIENFMILLNIFPPVEVRVIE